MKSFETIAQVNNCSLFRKTLSLDNPSKPETVPDTDGTLLLRLVNGSKSEQMMAAEELRNRTREIPSSRKAVLASDGGPAAILQSLRSPDLMLVELAIAVLHNSCLSDDHHGLFVSNQELVSALIYVLRNGNNSSKSTAAATIFIVGRSVDMALKLVDYVGLFGPLVDLLKHGTERGQKDAAYALYCLTICDKGRIEAEKAGAVVGLLEVLDKGSVSLDEKAVAVLANLARCESGRVAIWEKGGLDALNSVLESGSSRAMDDAITAVFLMSKESPGLFRQVVAEDLMPSIIRLSTANKVSSRTQQKAKVLVDQFRALRITGPNLEVSKEAWGSFSSQRSSTFSSFRSDCER